MATPDPAGLALTYGADVLVDVGIDAGRARRTLSRYGWGRSCHRPKIGIRL